MNGLGDWDEAAVTDPTARGSAIALLKGLLTKLATAATGLLKLEDAAHASGDAGVQMLAVRKATPTDLSGTDGDYEPLQLDEGRLHVRQDKGVTILRAAISAASSGDNTLVAAVASKKIKVLSLVLIAAGDVDVRLESGASGTALTGVIELGAAGNGFVLPPSLPGMHWLETAAGELLNLELDGAVQVSGFIVYYTEA